MHLSQTPRLAGGTADGHTGDRQPVAEAGPMSNPTAFGSFVYPLSRSESRDALRKPGGLGQRLRGWLRQTPHAGLRKNGASARPRDSQATSRCLRPFLGRPELRCPLPGVDNTDGLYIPCAWRARGIRF